jgi:hypothetical protein
MDVHVEVLYMHVHWRLQGRDHSAPLKPGKRGAADARSKAANNSLAKRRGSTSDKNTAGSLSKEAIRTHHGTQAYYAQHGQQHNSMHRAHMHMQSGGQRWGALLTASDRS